MYCTRSHKFEYAVCSSIIEQAKRDVDPYSILYYCSKGLARLRSLVNTD